MNLTTILSAAVAAAALAGLSACGSEHPVVLNGIQPGMPMDAVQAAAPAGTGLYCRGDGNPLLDRSIGGGISPTHRSCVWESAADGGSIAPVAVGGQTATSYFLIFAEAGDGTWHLDTYHIAMPFAAYESVVKAESAELGEPKDVDQPAYSLLPLKSVQWTSAQGVLQVTEDPGFGMPAQVFVTLNMAPAGKA